MSLELNIKELNETLRELIEVLTRTSLAEAQGAAQSVVAQSKTPTPTGKKPAPKTVAKPVEDDFDIEEEVIQSGKSEIVKSVPKKAPVKAASSITYDQVKEVMIKAISKGCRNDVVSILADFGAKTGQDLQAEDYPEVLKLFKVLVEGEDEGSLC